MLRCITVLKDVLLYSPMPDADRVTFLRHVAESRLSREERQVNSALVQEARAVMQSAIMPLRLQGERRRKAQVMRIKQVVIRRKVLSKLSAN